MCVIVSMSYVMCCIITILCFVRYESVQSDGDTVCRPEIHTSSTHGSIWQPGWCWTPSSTSNHDLNGLNFNCYKHHHSNCPAIFFNPTPALVHLQMGMVGSRIGQPNVNQIQNQYLSQVQYPGSGPGVGTAQHGMAQPGAQTGMPQVKWPGAILSVDNSLLSTHVDLK